MFVLDVLVIGDELLPLLVRPSRGFTGDMPEKEEEEEEACDEDADSSRVTSLAIAVPTA